MSWQRNGGGTAPWGWWLRAGANGLEGGDGRTWRSVRDAFWEGELRFPKIHVAPEQHELLLRVLTALENRWFNGVENRHDLFGGDMMFWRFYMCWLSSIGLIETTHGESPLEAHLTDLGRSVSMMLQATRQPDWVELPIESVVEAIRAPDLGAADDAREAALVAFEGSVARRPHLFARERVYRSHLVTLTGLGTGARMPVRRVMWSQSFNDERARDDFFAWLAQRVDRWDDWGHLAYSKGTTALTQHFFSLMVEAGSTSAVRAGG